MISFMSTKSGDQLLPQLLSQLDNESQNETYVLRLTLFLITIAQSDVLYSLWY